MSCDECSKDVPIWVFSVFLSLVKKSDFSYLFCSLLFCFLYLFLVLFLPSIALKLFNQSVMGFLLYSVCT